jgi:beta-lactam-binding protein with PASTA domain
MSPEEAKGELHKEGFVMEASCVVAPHETAPGTVVSQTPSPGSPVENGYLVRLTFAQRSCQGASLK